MNLYHNHLATLQQHVADFLQAQNATSLLLSSGITHYYYDDDVALPHRMPASFAHFIPEAIGANQFLLLTATKRTLFSYRPRDYWLKVQGAFQEWSDAFTIHYFSDLETLFTAINKQLDHKALWLGEDLPSALNVQSVNRDQKNRIDSWRIIKTEFEIDNLFQASVLAATGHVALKESFDEGVSEFDAHLDYLGVLQYTEPDLPYGNIVAYNEHASILHYQHLDRDMPAQFNSFLLDAGATHKGYIADISRTHAGDNATDTFIELLEEMRIIKLALIDQCTEGTSYIDIHKNAQKLIATLLIKANIIINIDVDRALEKGLARVFFPHGIGHLLGLNTHDTAGIAKTLTDESLPFKSLRLTHHLKNGMVLTIEPGIYFNPLLIDNARNNPDQAAYLNNEMIESLMPYGGIRDEDNIVICGDKPRNLTAEAFAFIGVSDF